MPPSGNLLLPLPHGGLATESNPALRVDVDHLDENLVPLVDLVLDLPNALLRDLGDVDETLDTRKDLDEGPEVDDPHHLADIRLPELGLGRELADDVDGL